MPFGYIIFAEFAFAFAFAFARVLVLVLVLVLVFRCDAMRCARLKN